MKTIWEFWRAVGANICFVLPLPPRHHLRRRPALGRSLRRSSRYLPVHAPREMVSSRTTNLELTRGLRLDECLLCLFA